MCLFTEHKETLAKANDVLKRAIATLPEANAKQVTSVTPKANAAGDKVKPSKLNKQDGFKITDENSKKKVKAGKIRRENSLNTASGKKRVVGCVQNSKRIKTLVVTGVTKGKNKGDWNYSITGVLG